MFEVTKGIIESYFQSDEYNEFKAGDTPEDDVKEMTDTLARKLGEKHRDALDLAMMGAFSSGEYCGMIQGMSLGFKLASELK